MLISKNSWLSKIICVILIFATVATVIPMGLTLNSYAAEEHNTQIPEIIPEEYLEEYGIESRDPLSEDSLYSYVMNMKNGEKAEVFYPYPVKYIDTSGEIKDKTTSLIETDEAYISESSDIQASFSKNLSEGITISYGKYSVTIYPNFESEETGILSENKKIVTYRTSFGTISYTLLFDGIKEEIVLDECPGTDSWTFDIVTENAFLKEENGQICLIDGEETVMYFGSIFCFTADEKNNTFGDISISENKALGSYVVTVSVSSTWLNSEETAYPVTVDPTISVNYASGSGAIQDEILAQNGSYSQYYDVLYIGKDSNGGKLRGVMCFPNLNIQGKIITSACVEIRDVMCESYATPVECYEYTGASWNENTVLTWANASNYGDLLDFHYVKWANGNTQADQQRYSFDITELAQKWAAGLCSPSQGILFKTSDDFECGNSNTHRCFASSNYSGNSQKPSLVITYVEPTGYNPSFTFDSRDIDESITVLNYHNYGNLLAVYSFDANTNGFPLPIFYAYNSTDNLWKLSLYETISEENGRYRYVDGYGTESYFIYDSDGVYKNEALSGTLEVSGAVASLEFGDEIIRNFNLSTGRIASVEYDHNVYSYVYGTYGITEVLKNGTQIFGLIYSSGRLSSAFGCSFYYSGNNLSGIADKYGNRVNFTYTLDSNDNLTSFDIQSSLATNGLKYFFNASGKINRAVKYRGNIENNITDDTYSYGNGYTRRFSNLKNIDENDPNDLSVTYVFDYTGITVNEICTDSSGNVVSAEDMRTDNLSSGTIVGVGNINLLDDSSFEVIPWPGCTRIECSEAVMGKHVSSLSVVSSKQITLSAGTYCFSAYVKGDGAKASLSVIKTSEGENVNSKTYNCSNDWIRIYVTFSISSNQSVMLMINNSGSDALLIDCLQLEIGNSPTTYNILKNSGFENGSTNWTGGTNTVYPMFGQHSQSLSNNETVSQTAYLGGVSDSKSYTVSGWLLPLSRQASAEIEITFNGGQADKITVPFNGFSSSIEYLCVQFAVPKNVQTVNTITVSVKNTSSYTVCCDNLLLSFGNVSSSSEEFWGSEGLTYTSNGDGTCILTGIGTCTDTDIVIPEKSPMGDTVTSIAAGAFQNNTSITSVVISDEVTLIGANAFRNCTNLETVTFGEKVERVNSAAFAYCSSLKNVYFNDSVTFMDSVAFGYCSSLEYVILPQNISALGTYAFCSCGNLKQVVIPKTCTSIQSNCFVSANSDFKIYYAGTSSQWANISKGSGAIPSNAQFKYDAEEKDGYIYTYTYSGANIVSTTVEIPGSDAEIKEYEYDANGNVISFTDQNGNETVYSYDSNSNLTSVSSNGRTTSYTYNNKDDLISETDANGNTTTYSYYTNGLLFTVTKGSSMLIYSYSNGLVSSVQIYHANTETYTYTYNAYGNILQINVGSIPICTYTYTIGGRANLRSKTESNGYVEYFKYDSFGNITETKAGTTVKSSSVYDGYGNILSQTDGLLNTSEIYAYTPDGIYVSYVFDASGNLVKYTDFEGNTVLADGTVITGYNEDVAVDSESDEISRETEYALTLPQNDTEADIFRITKTYLDQNTNYSSSEVVTETFTNGSYFTYVYDQNGNLTQISENGTVKNKYYYDVKNELVREDNAYAGKSYTWQYDNNGNILSKKTYSYTTGTLGTATETIAYSYGNSSVKDLLTSYNGTDITFSGLNPTKWRNASSISWTGRKMTSLMSLAGNTTNYSYDAEGNRVSKTTGTNTTRYIWNDGKLIREITPNYTISYFYDGDEVIGFNTLGGNYYYGKDTFGVIRYIYAENGNIVTTYTYDAWGRVLSVTGTSTLVGTINPIRYKSYYYDSETGFYYLISRYYDPMVGRFLNEDDPAYLGVSGSVLGWNLFAYNANNPLETFDRNGTFGTPIQWIFSIIGGISGWFFGDYIARGLGLLPTGKGVLNSVKYWAVRSAAVLGGATLGWFAGTTLIKLAQSFLVQRPSVLLTLINKAGASILSVSIIYDMVKAVVFDAGCIVLDALKCPISKDMYMHGLYGNGKQYSSSKLNKKIRNNSFFLNKLSNILQYAEGDVIEETINIKGSDWGDRDLAYSIGEVNVDIKGSKYNNVWHLVISVDNQYDFTEWLVKRDGFSLGNAANDFGHILSMVNIMKDYNIYIYFSMTVTA